MTVETSYVGGVIGSDKGGAECLNLLYLMFMIRIMCWAHPGCTFLCRASAASVTTSRVGRWRSSPSTSPIVLGRWHPHSSPIRSPHWHHCRQRVSCISSSPVDILWPGVRVVLKLETPAWSIRDRATVVEYCNWPGEQ